MWLSCVLLCSPVTCSFPGSSVHGIFQIRIPEWAPIPFSRGSSQHMDWTWVSHSTDRFFIIWATRETHNALNHSFIAYFSSQVASTLFLNGILGGIANGTSRPQVIECSPTAFDSNVDLLSGTRPLYKYEESLVRDILFLFCWLCCVNLEWIGNLNGKK